MHQNSILYYRRDIGNQIIPKVLDFEVKLDFYLFKFSFSLCHHSSILNIFLVTVLTHCKMKEYFSDMEKKQWTHFVLPVIIFLLCNLQKNEKKKVGWHICLCNLNKE